MGLYIAIKNDYFHGIVYSGDLEGRRPFIVRVEIYGGYSSHNKELKDFLSTNFIWVGGINTLISPAKLFVIIDNSVCSWFKTMGKNKYGDIILQGNPTDLLRKPLGVLGQ